MSGDLLRALTHELRNSIAPIVNAVHLIRLRGGGSPELAGVLSIIDRQVAGMARTLDAVAEADRLTRGEIKLQRQRVDVAAVIEAALQSRKALLEKKTQRVRVVSGPRPIWIDADQGRLTQAIGQVLDNAIRYSDDGSEITIETSTREDNAAIRIRDSGRGITTEVLPHVFEAFALRQPSRAGLGLGLGITRALCELHGGAISAHSEGEGRGSEFTITLPLALHASRRAEHPVAASHATAAAHPPGSRRILVADDNQAVRNSFAAILREMGHDVRLAADGVQALEVAETWLPDFVILDVHMPKIDGYAIARKLRAQFPPAQMQLVMMSGTDLDQTTLSGAKQAGFDHCVDKTLAVKGLDALLRGEAPPIPA